MLGNIQAMKLMGWILLQDFSQGILLDRLEPFMMELISRMQKVDH